MPYNCSHWHIDTSGAVPVYHQIKENLRELIESQILAPEDALPSDQDIARACGVQRATVRRAVDELVQEGRLYRVAGIGTFVAQPKVVQVLPTVLGFSARMRQAGHTTLNRVLYQDQEPAPASVARRLHVDVGAPVLRLARLRIVDHEPLMIETSFLLRERFPDLISDDFVVRSLYDVIASRYGIHVVELDQTLEPVLMTDYEAQLLESAPGNPAMLIRGTALADGDDPIEVSKAIVRGDKCQYYFCMRSTA